MTAALMGWIILAVAGVVVAIVVVVNRVFVVESLKELRNVTWPTKEFAIQGAWVTVVFILVLATFLALIDWGVNSLMIWLVK
ncbi:MAG: preprotein translocase subunit SecE [Brevinematales bacterium]|nr:preprotein translocase subunit SecE [Brevinematales bacterium]